MATAPTMVRQASLAINDIDTKLTNISIRYMSSRICFWRKTVMCMYWPWRSWSHKNQSTTIFFLGTCARSHVTITSRKVDPRLIDLKFPYVISYQVHPFKATVPLRNVLSCNFPFMTVLLYVELKRTLARQQVDIIVLKELDNKNCVT